MPRRTNRTLSPPVIGGRSGGEAGDGAATVVSVIGTSLGWTRVAEAERAAVSRHVDVVLRVHGVAEPVVARGVPEQLPPGRRRLLLLHWGRRADGPNPERGGVQL